MRSVRDRGAALAAPAAAPEPQDAQRNSTSSTIKGKEGKAGRSAAQASETPTAASPRVPAWRQDDSSSSNTPKLSVQWQGSLAPPEAHAHLIAQAQQLAASLVAAAPLSAQCVAGPAQEVAARAQALAKHCSAAGTGRTYADLTEIICSMSADIQAIAESAQAALADAKARSVATSAQLMAAMQKLSVYAHNFAQACGAGDQGDLAAIASGGANGPADVPANVTEGPAQGTPPGRYNTMSDSQAAMKRALQSLRAVVDGVQDASGLVEPLAHGADWGQMAPTANFVDSNVARGLQRASQDLAGPHHCEASQAPSAHSASDEHVHIAAAAAAAVAGQRETHVQPGTSADGFQQERAKVQELAATARELAASVLATLPAGCPAAAVLQNMIKHVQAMLEHVDVRDVHGLMASAQAASEQVGFLREGAAADIDNLPRHLARRVLDVAEAVLIATWSTQGVRAFLLSGQHKSSTAATTEKCAASVSADTPHGQAATQHATESAAAAVKLTHEGVATRDIAQAVAQAQAQAMCSTGARQALFKRVVQICIHLHCSKAPEVTPGMRSGAVSGFLPVHLWTHCEVVDGGRDALQLYLLCCCSAVVSSLRKADKLTSYVCSAATSASTLHAQAL